MPLGSFSFFLSLPLSALEALCDYALYKSTFTLHYILVAIFSRWTWVSWYQNVSILDFIGAKDNRGDKWSYNKRKAPVKSSPSTNQHPTFYRPDEQVSEHWREILMPNRHHQITVALKAWRNLLTVVSGIINIMQRNRYNMNIYMIMRRVCSDCGLKCLFRETSDCTDCTQVTATDERFCN